VRESGYIVIRREFGVRYHPAHVSRLLKTFGQSLQRSPSAGRIRGTRRQSSAGKKKGGLPSKKGPYKEGRRTIVFADQSGFYLLPMVVLALTPR
jgi:hypothetical protein